ncbi:MAG TPA: hypothetical protein VL240_14105 [Candidatus Binatia bacterium]|nr:hypothetical protein [Candidatus Binatia bacterium]
MTVEKWYRKFAITAIAMGVITLLSSPARADDDRRPAAPYQQEIHVGIPAGAGEGFAFSPQIPSGMRLIIEHISAFASLPQGQRTSEIYVTTTAAGSSIHHDIFLTYQATASGYDTLAFTDPAKLYADPGSSVSVGVFLNSLAGPSDVWVKISGKLVPCDSHGNCPVD